MLTFEKQATQLQPHCAHTYGSRYFPLCGMQVWSALDKSPPGMLKEVILVDDASTMEHLHQPLTDEVETIPKTRLVRLQNRSYCDPTAIYDVV